MAEPRRVRVFDPWMLLAVTIWGVNFPVVKWALAAIEPHVFNAVRFLLATGFLLLIAKVRGESLRVSGTEFWHFLGLGLVHTSFYQFCFIEGIARTTAANSALILAATPAAVAVISRVFGVERHDRKTWIGIAIAFGGLYVVITHRAGSLSLSDTYLIGDLLTVAATLLWSTYTVLARPMLRNHSNFKLTSLSITFGTAPLVLFSGPALVSQDWQAVGPGAWGAVLFSGLLSIGVAYLIWNASVASAGSTGTAIYSNLIPVFAILVGWAILGEPLAMSQLAGGAAVLGGIMLARWRAQ